MGVSTYSVEAEAGEEGEGSAQSLEASHPAWLPAVGPWHCRCPFPGAGVPRQSPLSAARAPAAPSARLQRRPPGSVTPYIPLERAGGLGASVGRTRAVALPLLPSCSRSSRPALPFPNATGLGPGGWGVVAGRTGGHPSWLELLPGDPRPAAGFGPGGLPAQSSPGGVIFSRGWDARPGGRAPINVPLSPLFGGCRQLGARTPASISMETRSGLGKCSRASVSPPGSREGGRERRHPALRSPTKATGTTPRRWALRGELLARQTYPLPSCQPLRGSAVGCHQHPGAHSPFLAGLAPNPSAVVRLQVP